MEVPDNKNTHNVKDIDIKCAMDIAEVPLTSLQAVSAVLKQYYDSPHSNRMKGQVDDCQAYNSTF